ncbi:hypothetical protein L0657_21085 [Dyadobacter sp. CY345]|uniref:hypothetical protein n=1 Tax=Dyadobacter sp. CY345 TaxID=2909335 RepID=UPI001F30A81A|nr:hypothetical protein [Dyadobacter sp. CY345]MCF2446466.1 hypothetical protein [Dyadobacter sp. CY345]
MLRKSAELSLESSRKYLSSNAASYSYRINKTIVNWLKNRQNDVFLKNETSRLPTLKHF